eukprot:evm.model.NODE_14951_length_11981_cov_14.120358.4
MKLMVRDVGTKRMVVEVEPSLKIGELKTKLQAEHSVADPARQKMIYKGKVLKDADTIESTGVTEADFYVCMVSAPPKVCCLGRGKGGGEGIETGKRNGEGIASPHTY